jgi:hypothetical protein
MAAEACGGHGSMVDRKQRVRKGLEIRYNLQSHSPIDLLPPTRYHLLKFLKAPKIALPAGNPMFNT